MPRTQRLEVWFTQEEMARLDELARRKAIPRAAAVRMVLMEELDRQQRERCQEEEANGR